MKIGLLNPWAESAESQAVPMLKLAAERLGHTAVECRTSSDILREQPDFVLALASTQPKLTDVPTYGTLHEPRDRWLRNEDYLRNFFTYDGYFAISEHLQRFASDLMFAARRDVEVGYFYPHSCVVIDWDTPIRFEEARLAYFGTNWDRRREHFFRLIDREPWMDIYGPERSWQDMPLKSYRGSLPFDGMSVLEAYRTAGVGLCLQSEKHLADNIISSRVFEASAAGALTIAARMPWTEAAFGDAVLYIDQDVPDRELARQIGEHMAWVRANPDAAREMAAAANKIFREKFSLDVLLPNVIEYHEKFLARWSEVQHGPLISVIVRCGGRAPEILRRALHSIAIQNYRPIELVLVQWGSIDPNLSLEGIRDAFQEIRIISVPGAGRSKSLWTGLRECRGDYIAILDDDDEWMRGHLAGVYKAMLNGNGKFAFSGSVRHHRKPFQPTSHANEAKMEEFRGIQSFPLALSTNEPLIDTFHFALDSTLIAHELLDEWSLIDPDMSTGEDSHLLMNVLTKAAPVFSYQATCVYFDSDDSSDWTSHADRVEDLARLRLRFFGVRFVHTSGIIGPKHLRELGIGQPGTRNTSGATEYVLPYSVMTELPSEESWVPIPLSKDTFVVSVLGTGSASFSEGSLSMKIKPPVGPWSYGLLMRVRCENTKAHIVRLSVLVFGGTAGFGILNESENEFDYRVLVPPSEDGAVVFLPIRDPSKTGRIVVQSTDDPDIEVRVQSVELLASDEPTVRHKERATGPLQTGLRLFRKR